MNATAFLCRILFYLMFSFLLRFVLSSLTIIWLPPLGGREPSGGDRRGRTLASRIDDHWDD